MREIIINSTKDKSILTYLNKNLGGVLTEKWGESTLQFDNEIGKGIIRNISFDGGISLLDYECVFNEPLKLVFKTTGIAPMEFIFISKGSFKYSEDNTERYLDLEQYQNIIISPKQLANKTFVFPEGEILKVNFIRIFRKEYLKKKNNNVTYLNELLATVFNDDEGNLPYMHGGSFSLKIEDQVKELGNIYENGIIRTLSIEGRIYLILALQLMEHHDFETNNSLPEALSKNDIKKIHRLTEYILDNISGQLTVDILAREACISPKKLQLGFKVLFSKTVNEYIRQLKLEISRDFLKNTDLSVSEVVYAVGIKSRSYFSKIFNEAYGILPTEYRKQLKVGKVNLES
jgi:AraC-like DNA-binding protein